MRQANGALHEAVEWLRTSPRSFSVVHWRPDGLGLSWTQCSTTAEALSALRNL
jgi:hypothetical protein